MSAEDHDSSCAFLFPGQGAQKIGMAVDLCAAVRRAQRVFDHGKEILGFDVLGVCRDGPEAELQSTRVSQPAIFLHSIAMLEALSAKFSIDAPHGTGLPASAAAGLSLGEYSALVFVGAIRFEDALRIVGKRGEYMQAACDDSEGAMASVLGLGPERIEEVVAAAVAEGLEVGVANYNSPAQTVISGAVDAVEACSGRLTEAGARRVVRLKVAGAYHSPLMHSATEKLEPLLAELEIAAPRVPFFGNFFGRRVEDPDEIRSGLVRQVEGSVRWDSCVRGVIGTGTEQALEVGPGAVLQGLVKNIDRGTTVQPISNVEALDNLQAIPV